MSRRCVAPVLVALLIGSDYIAAQPTIFRTSTERVTLAVIARDRNGRRLAGLSVNDFQVLDDGESRTILDFRNDTGPVSVALLLDSSGSMHGSNLQRANEVAHLVLASMNPNMDEAALFVFDETVHVAHPFGSEFDGLRSALASVHPFGSTALHDAIAETAQQLAGRPGRRALVVLTDGIDTSSRLTAGEVSGIASAIDIPVYLVVVGMRLDVATPRSEDDPGDLTDLARWSGGMFYGVANVADGSIAARQIVDDLRHQYLLAFEPDSKLGWHRIEVRARQRATLQARSGYWVGPSKIER